MIHVVLAFCTPQYAKARWLGQVELEEKSGKLRKKQEKELAGNKRKRKEK